MQDVDPVLADVGAVPGAGSISRPCGMWSPTSSASSRCRSAGPSRSSAAAARRTGSDPEQRPRPTRAGSSPSAGAPKRPGRRSLPRPFPLDISPASRTRPGTARSSAPEDEDKRASAGTGLVSRREMATAEALAQTGTPPPEARGLRRRDGRPPARDLRLRVLHQEPAPPRLRQPAEGAAHLRQGGGGQRARRRRGGGHPARRRGKIEVVPSNGAPCPRQPGDAVPRHGHRQRPRHRPPPDPADLRQAPLRLEVPPPPDEPRPAGHRDHRRGHVRPAHDRASRVQITSRTSARSPAHYFEVQIDTKKNEPRIFGNTTIEWECHRGTQVTVELEGALPAGPGRAWTTTSSRRPSPIRT